MTKVSIIIPFNKDRGWLKDAIKSVPESESVELILSKGDGNWPQNFNKGLQQATGDYIKYLHEDDMLAPLCIEHSLACFAETGADFIHGDACEIKMFKSNSTSKYKIPSVKNPTLEDLIRMNTIHSTTLMYKRDVFDKVGLFNESDKVYSFEEFEFNLRCLKAGLKIGYCDKVLAFYRRHPNQIIKTADKNIRMKNRKELINQYL